MHVDQRLAREIIKPKEGSGLDILGVLVVD